MKPKIVAIGFLTIWMLQGTLLLLVYQWERFSNFYNNQLLIEKQAVNEEIQTLVFGKNEPIEWEVKGKELIYKGKLHDVVSMSTTVDSVVIRCLADEKEDKLVSRFHETQKKQSSPWTGHAIVKKIDKAKYLVSNTLNLTGLITLCEQKFGVLIFKLPNRVNDVHSPPPEGQYS